MRLEELSNDTIFSVLMFLNYKEIFIDKTLFLSKMIYFIFKNILTSSKCENQISIQVLSLFKSREELSMIPIVLFSPGINGSLKRRLNEIFLKNSPCGELFIANIYTNNLSFAKKEDNDIILISRLRGIIDYLYFQKLNKKLIT